METYANLIVYYFSGTGNAQRTAEWIVSEGEKQELNCKLVNIEKDDNIKFMHNNGRTLIGFCCPTHGFNLPPIMLEFILKFPKQKETDAFLVNTRGGTRLGKWNFPGLSGIAQVFPALILRAKGIRTVAFRPVDLPSNWISLHPGMRKSNVEGLILHWHDKVRQFAQQVLKGEKIYVGLYTLPIDLLIAPISVVYYLVGRFVLAKTFIATDACSHCGLCVKQCPVQAIEERKSLYWAFRCESCMRCMSNCPERAIETAHGFSILLWWAIFSILPIYITRFVTEHALLNLENLFLKQLLEFATWGLGMIIIWLAYMLLNYLLRFRFFNNMVAYTSLTKLWFWNRYKFPAWLAKKIRSIQ